MPSVFKWVRKACECQHPDPGPVRLVHSLMKSDRAHGLPRRTCLAVAWAPGDLLCIIQLWGLGSLRLPWGKDPNFGSGWVHTTRRETNLASAENVTHLTIYLEPAIWRFSLFKTQKTSQIFCSCLFNMSLSSKASFLNCIHKDIDEWFNYLSYEHIHIFSNNPKAVITTEQAGSANILKAQRIILQYFYCRPTCPTRWQVTISLWGRQCKAGLMITAHKQGEAYVRASQVFPNPFKVKQEKNQGRVFVKKKEKQEKRSFHSDR